MMKLACKDLDPSTTCMFEATGETKEEVAGKMLAHVKSDHPDKMSGMGQGAMGMLASKAHS